MDWLRGMSRRRVILITWSRLRYVHDMLPPDGPVILIEKVHKYIGLARSRKIGDCDGLCRG